MKYSRLIGLAWLVLFFLAPLYAGADSTGIGEWRHAGFIQWHTLASDAGLGMGGTQCYFCRPDPDGDDDKDGVVNGQDKCPHTPPGAHVDGDGCPRDSDRDGVPDYMDQCPNTSPGARVDVRGCVRDSDRDGVLDDADDCPNTPQGATVTRRGCWVINNLTFRYNEAVIDSSSFQTLNAVRDILQKNSRLRVEIQGHTDNKGSHQYNKALSTRRAKAAMRYLVEHGIEGRRLSFSGHGEERPVASNDTEAGRAENRRAELRIMK